MKNLIIVYSCFLNHSMKMSTEVKIIVKLFALLRKE